MNRGGTSEESSLRRIEDKVSITTLGEMSHEGESQLGSRAATESYRDNTSPTKQIELFTDGASAERDSKVKSISK